MSKVIDFQAERRKRGHDHVTLTKLTNGIRASVVAGKLAASADGRDAPEALTRLVLLLADSINDPPPH